MDDLAAPALASDEGVASGSAVQFLAIKSDAAFLVADSRGDIRGGADGLFRDDIRVLSHFRFLVGERRPSQLSSGLSHDSVVFTFHGSNLGLPPVGGRATRRGVIHVERRRLLFASQMFEQVRCANYGLDEVMLPLAFEYEADFRDLFEVRGMKRKARGELAPVEADGRTVHFAYQGLDEVRRTSALSFSEPPWRMTETRADFMFSLRPGEHVDLFLEVGEVEHEPPCRERYLRALAGARDKVRAHAGRGGQVTTSDSRFGAWLDKSRADVAVLVTDLPTGPYPYAGIPWFSTPFGRDGIITAWQMLWLDPALARGVLIYLAGRQATEVSTFRDSQPGKIMHETRRGEMAATHEIPFGLYYGGVDTTPLFVALAGAYLERTGDLALIEGLWPALRAAVGWIETYGDSNQDGFIDYARGQQSGLSNQGWKDSEDSVFHADGAFPHGPVALVEVQGYAFAAFQAMATILERLGRPGAEVWAEKAEAMRRQVEERFWMDEAGFYGVAIDGEGQLCRPRTSNAGHLLFVGLPDPARAASVTRGLLSAEFDSGWGVRTLPIGTARFNPMSYHNGSIWPHDTALCVAGMARYGERQGAAKLLGDLFEAATHFEMRMPELFCGFAKDAGEPPIAYPVACMPQAWSAGSVFMMLQACLGLSIDAGRRQVRLVRPTLPAGVERLTIEGIEVAGARVDLRFQRMDGAVAVNPGPKSDRSISVVLDS
jgi:glycogen debranching enzyme